jgi:hypothetical protein
MSEEKAPAPAAAPSIPSTPFQTVVNSIAFVVTVLIVAITASSMHGNSLKHDETMITLSCQGCAKHTKPDDRENE